jgi:hypothetical protein
VQNLSRSLSYLVSGTRKQKKGLDEKPLNLLLDRVDLALKLASLVGGDAGSNHGPADATGSAERRLGWDENVGNVLNTVWSDETLN